MRQDPPDHTHRPAIAPGIHGEVAPLRQREQHREKMRPHQRHVGGNAHEPPCPASMRGAPETQRRYQGQRENQRIGPHFLRVVRLGKRYREQACRRQPAQRPVEYTREHEQQRDARHSQRHRQQPHGDQGTTGHASPSVFQGEIQRCHRRVGNTLAPQEFGQRGRVQMLQARNLVRIGRFPVKSPQTQPGAQRHKGGQHGKNC